MCRFAHLLLLPFLLASCTSSPVLNMIAHSQARNPRVMTEAQSLAYAQKYLRPGIKDIYVVKCDGINDSILDQSAYYYLASPELVFDAQGLEYDSVVADANLCRWGEFGAFYDQDSIAKYFRHTEKARTLQECLYCFKPLLPSDDSLTLSDSVGHHSVTFLLGLSPDNRKLNLRYEDINSLYDAWNGQCRIIVVITNPQDTWGLKTGRRVRYRIEKLTEREANNARYETVNLTFSYPKNNRHK